MHLQKVRCTLFQTPMFYVLHGPDELSRTEALAALKARLSDPALGDLNTAIFDGGALSLGELQQVCNSLPFMSAQRLVVACGAAQQAVLWQRRPDTTRATVQQP